MSLRGASVSRRAACALAASGALAALGLGGCSDGSEAAGGEGQQGFASDALVYSEPVTLYILADSRLQRSLPSSSLSRVEDYFARYQEQAGREQVTFAVKYADARELAALVGEGYEGTAVIALERTVQAACDAGTLHGGDAGTSVRSFTAQLYETLMVLRREGGSAQMPAADTVTGEDSEDGQVSRMQNLARFEGVYGICAEEQTEGMLANRVLARWGFYSGEDGTGGEYAQELEGKLLVCASPEELCQALADGRCQLAFGVQSMLWGGFDGVEEVYQPAFGGLVYSGASVAGAEHDAAARDFLEFITRCV